MVSIVLIQTLKLISMLGHQKLVIRNVANNKDLFRKEIQKSFNWLNEDDIRELSIWLNENYSDSHQEILKEFIYEDVLNS